MRETHLVVGRSGDLSERPTTVAYTMCFLFRRSQSPAHQRWNRVWTFDLWPDLTRPGQWTFLKSFIAGLCAIGMEYRIHVAGVPNYFVILLSSSSVSGRLKYAAYKLTRRMHITQDDVNIVLVIYQRNENEADYQIMCKKGSRSRLTWQNTPFVCCKQCYKKYSC